VITEATDLQPYRDCIDTLKRVMGEQWWSKYSAMILADMQRDFDAGQA
jgi:hypothetical protein